MSPGTRDRTGIRRTLPRHAIPVLVDSLVLGLAACSHGSGSGDLDVRGISVPDFGRWECNRPIEFVFDQPIDFASVGLRSIHIRTALDVPAAGTFAAKTSSASAATSVPARSFRVSVSVDTSHHLLPSRVQHCPGAVDCHPGMHGTVRFASPSSSASQPDTSC